MAFQLSPGVQVKEIDLSNVIPAVASSTGGFAGNFPWGPVEEVQLVTSEKDLADQFGLPAANGMVDFMTAAYFLKYGNALRNVRVIDTNALNANTDAVDPDTGATEAETLIKNRDHYDIQLAEYPKTITTSADNAAGTTITLDAGDGAEVTIGDVVTGTGITTGSKIVDIDGDVITIDNAHSGIDGSTTAVSIVADVMTGEFVAKYPGVLGNSLKIEILPAGGDFATWTYMKFFESAPGTSDYVSNRGGEDDEMHIVVIDEDGVISGTPMSVLETFGFVSQAKDAKTVDGATNYYADVLNNSSKYVWFGAHPEALALAGSAGEGVTFTDGAAAISLSFTGGVDSSTPTMGQYMQGFDLLADPELVDVNLLFMPKMTAADAATMANYVIAIAEARKDCVAFVSPSTSATVGSTDPLTDVLDFANALNSSSYGVIDSTALKVYDKYHDQYLWIPASSSTAGLCARTDDIADAWFSPAGFNRGQVQGVTKIAFNPKQAQRDDLYQSRVNPIVTFPGEGTILYGDKTAQSKPSAFDRINVRRLFIVLEKAIATAAKYQLFEFNDSTTRAQFRGMVESFLREVKGRRGIYDFAVVCDETNNTGAVIDSNSFVADIYIKPARSINFMTLNFIATRTGVDFSEVIGK
jgi:hypothetical protein